MALHPCLGQRRDKGGCFFACKQYTGIKGEYTIPFLLPIPLTTPRPCFAPPYSLPVSLPYSLPVSLPYSLPVSLPFPMPLLLPPPSTRCSLPPVFSPPVASLPLSTLSRAPYLHSRSSKVLPEPQ
jgi:hypothetical protein